MSSSSSSLNSYQTSSDSDSEAPAAAAASDSSSSSSSLNSYESSTADDSSGSSAGGAAAAGAAAAAAAGTAATGSDSEDFGEASPGDRLRPKVEASARKALVRPPRVRQWSDPTSGTLNIWREKEERKASWNELFYDLIFVATIAALGHSVAAVPDWKHVGLFMLFFSPVWFTWYSTTVYINRFDAEDMAHKLFFFGQMLSVTGVVIFHESAFDTPTSALGFACSAMLARFLLAIMHVIAGLSIGVARNVCEHEIVNNLAVASLFLLGGLMAAFGAAPESYIWCFIAADVLEFLLAFLTQPVRVFSGWFEKPLWVPFNIEHLIERFGIFTIVYLGEIIVGALSTPITKDGITVEVAAAAVGGLAIAFCLQWLYFDAESEQKTHAIRRHWWSGNLWLASHLFLHASIIVLAAGVLDVEAYLIARTVYDGTHSGAAVEAVGGAATAGFWSVLPGSELLSLGAGAPSTGKPEFQDSFRWLLCGGLAGVLVCLSLIGLTHHSQHTRRIRWELRVSWRLACAVVSACLPLAGDGIGPIALVWIIAGLSFCVVVVEVYGSLESFHSHWWNSDEALCCGGAAGHAGGHAAAERGSAGEFAAAHDMAVQLRQKNKEAELRVREAQALIAANEAELARIARKHPDA